MIALDTNVLVRYLVNDNRAESEAARKLAESLKPDEPGYVCREVIVELVWVLERSYGFSREDVSNTLEEMLVTDELVLESADDVWSSSLLYREGVAGFSDLMIVAASQRAEAPLYTLDQSTASRLDGVEWIPVAQKPRG
jgi:predicted nucleic-acid-binding protein